MIKIDIKSQHPHIHTYIPSTLDRSMSLFNRVQIKKKKKTPSFKKRFVFILHG